MDQDLTPFPFVIRSGIVSVWISCIILSDICDSGSVEPLRRFELKSNDVIQIIHDHVSTKFPKVCGCCGKNYADFAEFVRQTVHVGEPVSYDAELNNWQPSSPIGTIGMANCACGSTMAISSDGMSLPEMWRLMGWAKEEAEHRNISISELLVEIRVALDKRALEQS